MSTWNYVRYEPNEYCRSKAPVKKEQSREATRYRKTAKCSTARIWHDTLGQNSNSTHVRSYLKQICLQWRAWASLLFSREITYLSAFMKLRCATSRVFLSIQRAHPYITPSVWTATHLIETLNRVTAFVHLIRFKSIHIIYFMVFCSLQKFLLSHAEDAVLYLSNLWLLQERFHEKSKTCFLQKVTTIRFIT